MRDHLSRKSFFFCLFVCCLGFARLAAADLASPNAPALESNAPAAIMPQEHTPAPELGALPTPGAMWTNASREADLLKKFQMQLDLGREQRHENSIDLARHTLSGLMTSDAPMEIKRQAMFELAMVAEDENKFVQAEQILGQYVHAYPEDPSVPEILLREGLIYRRMGVNSLAISKFYAVMSTALKLKLDNMEYYKKIVLQSQIEIAETYYVEGKYDDAADFFRRLLKSASDQLDLTQAHFKLVRSLSYTTNSIDTVSQAQIFLDLFPKAYEVPEVRFFLATALKKLGRNNDSMKQVLMLLQSQEQNSSKNPEVWAYWQQRAGNEIANQLYKEGDYLSALQIYTTLGQLDKSPGWQLPVWYQTALVYEQLEQWSKATDIYQQIIDRQKELTEKITTPALQSIEDMAKWRKDYIAWMQKAKLTQQSFTLSKSTNAPPAPATP